MRDDDFSLAATGAFGRAVPDYSLANLSRWRIGGKCSLLVEPDNTDQLIGFVKAAAAGNWPYLVIGNGSNLLFSDSGFRGICLKVGERYAGVENSAELVTAHSGVWIPCLARWCASHGLSGIEHVIGIPGNLGGLLAMNGGSLRQSISEKVVRVTSLTRSGEIRVRRKDECEFGYRSSIFRKTNEIVLTAEFELQRKNSAEIRRAMLEILRSRREKFPLKLPNCGSVFLSDPAMYSVVGPPGKAIEQAGLKGKRIGSAEVSERHANFFVNRGGATAADMLQLIRLVQETVAVQTGFRMSTEVIYVDSAGRSMPADQVERAG